MNSKPVYRIIFDYEEKHYEVYARKVVQSNLHGFIEIEDIIVNESSELVVEPSEERFKTEFNGVTRSYIPMHTILRIDEVEKEGMPKILSLHPEAQNVSPFPGKSLNQPAAPAEPIGITKPPEPEEE